MLRVDNLAKTYPPAKGVLRLLMKTSSDVPVDALKGVSFAVEPGEVVGLVGSNGAGKTTLFRIIATLLEPTSGHVLVDGRDIVQHPRWARGRIGLLLEGERGVYKRLTGLQNLEFFGVIQGMSRDEALARGSELMERLGLAARDQRVFGYSAGMRVRLALARALMADPPLLLLDEPTRSLDPLVSVDAMGLASESAANGQAVLISSHRLEEIRTFCTRVVVMTNGEVRYDGPTDDQDLIALMADSKP